MLCSACSTPVVRCAAAGCHDFRGAQRRLPHAHLGIPHHTSGAAGIENRAVHTPRGPTQLVRVQANEGVSVTAEDGQPDYENVLHTLLQGDVASLRQLPDDHVARSMDFLVWLAEYEIGVEDELMEEVNGLAGRLVAMREGLDPSSVDKQPQAEHSPELSESVALTSSLPDGPARNSFAIEVQKAARMALTPEGNSVFEEKISSLRDGMVSAKRDSAMQLMGRHEFPTLKQAKFAEQAAAAADASGRILSFLLELSSRAERQAILPDAFKPPEPSSPEADTEDEEQLFTSPFALLSAIDMELARFKREVRVLPNNGLLTGGVQGAVDESVLRELREDVLDYIDSSVVSQY